MAHSFFKTHWKLVTVVAISLVAAGALLFTNVIPDDRQGRWVQDERGVWQAIGQPSEVPAVVREQQFLITEALMAYKVLKDAGQDLSTGPCLGVIFHDWVADIAHAPRQPADEEPANQCEGYRNGTANHFIELSPSGDVLRAL